LLTHYHKIAAQCHNRNLL